MAEQLTIPLLKRWLLHDVAYLSSRSDVRWSRAIAEMIRDLKRASFPAVYFGGALRSLLLGRLSGSKRLGRPRDIDIVVADASMSALKSKLGQDVVRQTRFGGLQIKRNSWNFDLWPLHQTWAFKDDASLSASFEALPETTFFNLEAIAVDIWAPNGRSRQIYSGDDRFFEGLLSRTVELNREANPYPALCVVRSLVLASSTRFLIGPRLAEYLKLQRDQVTDLELDDVQRHHYGHRRLHVGDMRRLLEFVARESERSPGKPIEPPLAQQFTLWKEEKAEYPRVTFHSLDPKRSRGLLSSD